MNGGCVQRLQHSSRGGEGSEQKNNGPGRKEQEDENQSMAQRRLLRFQYRNLKSSIAEEREEILKTDTDKFESLIHKVQHLHNLETS